MKILVTGGVGRIGRFTVSHLMARGHNVRILDRVAESDINPDVLTFIHTAEYHQVDITDYVSIRPYFDGIEAVVHLAAIPYPIPNRDVEIFDINCGGAFHVYQAAADAGMHRVVSASSINALGNGFGVRPIDVHYFPIDEGHPTWTSDVYSFSKKIVEETAAYFWRRAGISGVCMRFPWVYDPAWFPADEAGTYFARIQQEYRSLLKMSKSERQAAMNLLRERFRVLREKRARGEINLEEMFQQMQPLPYRAILHGRSDFWSILDVRDAARAILLALTADYEGSHILNIADSCNATGLPTKDLAGMFYPQVTTWKRSVTGIETLFCIDKARTLINFAPQHSLARILGMSES
jgi:nucleoside-diphosphate-sugar epimerase